MGLDMYLTARKFHSGDDALEIGRLMGVDVSSSSPHAYTEVNLAYWRKANQVHGWFVKNVQDGVDECQQTGVSSDDLKTLLSTCEKVLEHLDNGDTESARTLLPPAAGFFFGSIEVDEWYRADIEYTVEELKKVLAMNWLKGKGAELYDLYYQASW